MDIVGEIIEETVKMPTSISHNKTSSQTETLPGGKDTSTGEIVNPDVPYLDYESEHSSPFLVDYFVLGDTWNDPQGGFPKEIASIEGYIQEKIESGEIANSITAVKNMIRSMEKINNLSKEERSVVKIEILNNYVDFMRKNEGIKRNLRRYSNA